MSPKQQMVFVPTNVAGEPMDVTETTTAVVASSALGGQAPVIEAVALPIVEVQGASHVVSFVSAGFCALLGKTSAELVGKTFAEIAPGGGSDGVAPLDHAWQAAEAAAHAVPAGARLTDEGAPLLYASWPSRDGTDARTGVVIQLTKTTSLRRNLTEANEALLVAGLRQHELTEAAHTLNAQLQQEVAERGRVEEALRQAMQDLALADRNKDGFLAMLAHELRSPLGPIKNAAHLLGTVNGDDDVAIVRRSQAIIERQVGHLARLVDELLDVARIQQGKIVLRREPLDLVQAVTDAVQSCEQIVRSQHHTITLDMPPATADFSASSIMIDGDATRIEQIVVNLVTNAAKFTPPHGRIDVKVSLEGGAAVVRVRDNGVGLAPEMVRQVFEVFTQVEQTIARSQGGLGLGLKIVRELVELHGGTVEARSDGLGTGTEFIVRLPTLEQRDQRPTSAPAVSPAKSVAWRILVVDDSADNCEMMAMLLSAFGHDVDTAKDGEEAVQKALLTRPEIAFVDIGLPKLSGYDVATAIRKQPGGEQIVLIAISGYGQPEDKRKALAAGFDSHLTKPVSPDDLRQILGSLDHFQRGLTSAIS